MSIDFSPQRAESLAKRLNKEQSWGLPVSLVCRNPRSWLYCDEKIPDYSFLNVMVGFCERLRIHVDTKMSEENSIRSYDQIGKGVILVEAITAPSQLPTFDTFGKALEFLSSHMLYCLLLSANWQLRIERMVLFERMELSIQINKGPYIPKPTEHVYTHIAFPEYVTMPFVKDISNLRFSVYVHNTVREYSKLMNLLPEPWADLGWAYYIAHYGKKGNLPLIVDLTKEIKDRVIKRAVREYHG